MFDVLDRALEALDEDLAAEDLIDELESIFFQINRLESRAASVLRQANVTGAFKRDGYSSMTALLKHRMSLHPGDAHRMVTRANGLVDTPLTRHAHEQGTITGAQVDVLLTGQFGAPEALSEAEDDLVALAATTPLVRDLRKQVDYRLDSVKPDDLAFQRHVVRELRAISLRRDGEMVRINGWMDIESGERLLASLEPGPPLEDDKRSAAARRADILLEIVDGASNRPALTVHVSAETLLSGASGISETGSGSFLTADEVQRIACDSDLTRVIFDSDRRPLDVGRTKRLVTPAIRTAITARDLRCVFPGCDRPGSWCDAHHIIHWIEGGTTGVDNLVLLCRHHHVLVHEAKWTIRGKPGDLHFHRPDGTELGTDPLPMWPPSTFLTVEVRHPAPGARIAGIRGRHGLPAP